MKCNVGGVDRGERIFHGVVFILVGIFLVTGLWSYILGGYGVIRLLTGVFAFCPAYVIFNLTTRRSRQ